MIALLALGIMPVIFGAAATCIVIFVTRNAGAIATITFCTWFSAFGSFALLLATSFPRQAYAWDDYVHLHRNPACQMHTACLCAQCTPGALHEIE